MKSAREQMDMFAVYNDVGSFRAAAAICSVDPKTVKRAIERREGPPKEKAEPAHNYDCVADLVAKRVKATKGRISAKRLLKEAKAAGYEGSGRNFRRLVAKEKATWHNANHRGRRPAVWTPGQTLVIDWGQEGPLHVFCAVLAWSRWRFVRFADNERSDTTLSMLAECFEVLGGVPKVVLADRMGCLKAGTVANLVVPTAEYVRFAAHYSFHPDFCEGGDPASKGIVENLVGYAKSDLLYPLLGARVSWNEQAAAWCCEVNSVVHSEICAVPDERLAKERELLSPLPSLRPRIGKAVMRKVDSLSCVRFGSARYSVPMSLIGKSVEVVVAESKVRVVHLGREMAAHDLVAPGETSVVDEHYGGPRPDTPARAPRPRTEAEIALVALGEVGVAFLKAAAAAGASKLGTELPAIMNLAGSYGEPALKAALERATTFSRFGLADVRSILEAGPGVPRLAAAGEALQPGFPVVPVRSLSAYAPDRVAR
ncbi:MAG: IS21 family transposase [Acidimicrobiales bacterium]